MKIEIYSIESIEKLAKSPFALSTSLISIGDTDAAPPNLAHKPNHILRLVFDDITFDSVKESYNLPDNIQSSDERLKKFLSERGINVFSDAQAGQIVDFVTKHRHDTDLLICQCHYGQSRSAGCAAAITECFYGNGVDIFADELYYPNKLVYRKVLDAFKKSEDEKSKDFSQKFSEAAVFKNRPQKR